MGAKECESAIDAAAQELMRELCRAAAQPSDPQARIEFEKSLDQVVPIAYYAAKLAFLLVDNRRREQN